MKKINFKRTAKLIGFAGLAILPSMGVFGQNTPKNIIMVIGDGMSDACVKATNYYQGKTQQAYEAFPVTTWQSTYNAKNPKGTVGGNDDASYYALEYHSANAWTDFGWAARDGRTGQKAGYTDSAPAATALSTGKKAADGVLNYDVDGNQLVTITERALEMGKKAGVVSTVQFTHATPAGYIAHNMDRNATQAIAREMLASKLSVIIGTGHPDYNENAQYSAGVQGYNYTGGETVWTDLLTGGITNLGGIVPVADIDGDATPDAWSLIQDATDFEGIANGSMTAPKRLLGIPRAGATLQAYRDGRNDERAETAYSTALNTGVPTLEEMSMAAINVLNSNNENGFFVMIEGGAIDWANHDNNAGRMIEEMIDLNNTIDAVIAWIETNGGWENNLLIYTSDHECGYITGPNHQGQTVNNPVDNPIMDNGAGNMPGLAYNSPNHTNMLVPVFAKGAGAELLKTHESRTDFYRGKFIDNTDIANSLFSLWTPEQPVKNFIFMISDGMGYNTIKANNLWEGKSEQVYETFPVTSAMSTYHGRAGNYAAGNTLALYRTGYNSALAWTDPEYINNDFTDSAPAATAMATGTKIYDGAINVYLDDSPLLTLPQVATQKGKSAGVVSSVQISHATPAGLGGAHNVNRNANAAIAQELFFDTNLSVAIGTGNPLYNDQGGLRAEPEHTWIGADAWTALTSGSTTSGANTAKDIDGDTTPDAWTLVQDKTDFQSIAAGENVPLRLAGVPKVYQTLQQRRVDAVTGKASAPFTIPFNANMPTLSELSLAALNVLNQNENGFFVMVEGGAIDWANHDNNLPFAIEEQHDFNRAVEAVTEWVEANSSWDETLLIVTSDHECGYLTGPNGKDINPFENPITANGTNTPGHAYYSGSHTNTLVPMYAKGAGADKLNSYRNMYDYVHGYYLDNTNIPNLVLQNWNKLPNTTPNINTSVRDVFSDKTDNVLNIYPTLVDDFVTIEGTTGNVEVITLSGQIVLSQTLTDNRVNLGSLAKGLYIVKVADKTAKIVKK